MSLINQSPKPVPLSPPSGHLCVSALFQYHQNENMAMRTCNPLMEVMMVITIFTLYTKGSEFLITWSKETVWEQILYHEATLVTGDILLMPSFLLFRHP